MPRFHFPVNIATTAIALVVGATSATAATHLVLATDTHPATTSAEAPPAGTPGGGNHDGPPHTSTTLHREHTTEPHPTTTTAPPSTTVTTTAPHHEPPYPYPTTSTTAKPTEHHEPTTSTTRPPEHHEPTTSTTAKPTTTTRPPTDTSVQTLTFACATGMPDGKPTASCRWSKSTAPGFHHYRLTREVVGTPRQEIFTTTDHDVTGYVDHDLQVGANYSYIIEAYDADGHLIAHSAPFHFTCCEGASTTT